MPMANQYRLTEFGRAGEKWAAQELRRRGFDVELIGANSDFDLLVEGRVRGEVKAAVCSRGARGSGWRWQFSLRRHGLLVDEDVLFLLCYGEDLDGSPLATFVIPGDVLPGTLSKIDITSLDPATYRGAWARYREDWNQVANVLEHVPECGQLVLFRSMTEEEIPF